MKIQIFGTKKNFEVKKAELFFSERRINLQKVDLKEKGISKGELENIILLLTKKTGSREAALENLIDKKNKDYASIAYLEDCDKEEKILENPLLLVQPVVRNGKEDVTVGYAPDEWKNW